MMPMADWFGADINVVPQGNIYPGSGPTIASAGGAMTATTQAVDSYGDQTILSGPSVSSTTSSSKSIVWWVGLLALLLVLVFGAHKAGGPEDFRNIRPTFYNFLTITLTSVVGIVGLKVIFSKWRIPGASDIILAA